VQEVAVAAHVRMEPMQEVVVQVDACKLLVKGVDVALPRRRFHVAT
jgi:hypothetical protein